jgi:hypothetical protein
MNRKAAEIAKVTPRSFFFPTILLCVLCAFAVQLACGGPQQEPAMVGDDWSNAAEPPAPPPPDAAPPRVREGTIDRAALDRVLAGGPGRLLATVEVRARVVKRTFSGWEVVRAPWPEVDLVPGDVVLLINRRTLERPLELESLWGELRTADAIVAEVERGPERFTLRFAVVGAPAAAAPP